MLPVHPLCSTASQTGTVPEQTLHVCYIFRIEVTHVKACQTGTAIEHVGHPKFSSHFRRIKTSYVKARQARTVREHTVHAFDIFRIEPAHIKARQVRTTFEHPIHICHVSCVEIT